MSIQDVSTLRLHKAREALKIELVLSDINSILRETGTLLGLACAVSSFALMPKEDLSGARSLSRARRRIAQGKRPAFPVVQEPAAIRIGGVMMVHPDVMDRFRSIAFQGGDGWRSGADRVAKLGLRGNGL